MPPGLYDREQEKQRKGLPPEDSPDFLRRREDLDNPDSKDNQASGDSSDPRELKDQEDPATTAQPEHQVGRGYVGEGKANLKGSGLSRRKKWLLAGISGSVVALIIAFMFGILGIFKLEHIMSNVDSKVHARMLGAVDGRSRRWMRAYVEIRLMDISDSKDSKLNLDAGDKSDNVFFRSDKVRRGNPMFNWYRTMRLSNFEAEVFEKNGFKFTSFYYYDEVSGQVRTRTAKISLNNRVLAELDIPDNIRASIEAGDIKAMREYPGLIKLEERFDNDRDARRAIRKMVNEDIPAWRIFLRRHVRKDIQNVNGVRDWRFFEKTRQAVHEKKIEIRNKILNKAIPANFKSGQILRCLFGVDNCRYSRDAYDPANRDEGVRSNGSGSPKPEESFTTDVDDNAKPLIDEEGKPKLDTRTANPNQISEDTAKLAARLGTKIGGSLGAFYAAVNITGTLEMLSQVNKAIPQLAKMAVIAKGAQAMGLFQVFETSRDQTKSGELTADEYNELMRVLNTPTQSEGWHKVIEGNDTNPKNANKIKKDYCDDRYVPTDKDFHYLCDDKKIGDASNAEEVQNKYNNGIGKAIDPIVDVYDDAKETPILGSVIKVLNKITEAVGELLSKAILKAASVVGLGDDIKSALTWVMGKLAVFLGAGPILSEDGSEKAGEYVNLIIQGGAYTAETAARGSGAAKTTKASKATSITTLNEYRQFESESSTAFSRTLALSNPQSLASKSLFAVSNFGFSSLGSIVSSPSKLFGSLGNLFSVKTQAANVDDGYRAANFAGIETNDFPPECINLNPLTDLIDGPLNGTNADEVLAQNKIFKNDKNREYFDKLESWETHTNSTEFYDTLYNIILSSDEHKENADNIAVTIYNCNLLDTRIRGATGYPYGYTDDNGLEDQTLSSTTTSTPPPTTNGFVFPVNTTQEVIKKGNDYNGTHYVWCYTILESCHHDYNAADIHAPTGTPVVAVRSGKVAQSFDQRPSERGSYVSYQSEADGRLYYTSHMKLGSIKVKVGDMVTAGQQIGEIGTPEDAQNTGPHIHFDALPLAQYKEKTLCQNQECQKYPFINIQPDLVAAFNALGQPIGGGGTCAEGSEKVGNLHEAYENNSRISITLCAINELPVNDFTSGQEGSESTLNTLYYIPGANGRALVDASVSGKVVTMVRTAKANGVNLVAFSSFRTHEHQQALASGGGAYAQPGYSRHQRGFAIDFVDSNRNSTANCRNIPGHTVNGRCVAPGDPIWEWLNKNAAGFGYKQLINESWHWSPDGE